MRPRALLLRFCSVLVLGISSACLLQLLTPCRHTNKNIAADEVVQDVSLGWDGKRDR